MQDYRSYRREMFSNLRTFTARDMQNKSIYLSRKIRTNEPKSLIKHLKSHIAELGYGMDKDTETKMQESTYQGPGGVRIPIFVTKESKKPGKSTRQIMAVGVPVTSIGIFAIFLNFYAGLLVLGLGEFAFIKWMQGDNPPEKGPEKKVNLNKIWLLLEGETYPAQNINPNKEETAKREQMISELTLHAAGESGADEKGLREELSQLIQKIDFLYNTKTP